MERLLKSTRHQGDRVPKFGEVDRHGRAPSASADDRKIHDTVSPIRSGGRKENPI